MIGRPRGISLLCAFFGIFGMIFLLNGANMLSDNIRPSVGAPESVQMLFDVYPIFLLILGAVGVFAAIGLLYGHPAGLYGGLTWVGLWILEEIVIGVWSITGPEIIQEASGSLGGTIVRVLVGVSISYYLISAGKDYVRGPF